MDSVKNQRQVQSAQEVVHELMQKYFYSKIKWMVKFTILKLRLELYLLSVYQMADDEFQKMIVHHGFRKHSVFWGAAFIDSESHLQKLLKVVSWGKPMISRSS